MQTKNSKKICKKSAERRLRLAGHCLRHPEEIASNLVLWQPTIGRTIRGRKTIAYVDAPKRNTALDDIQEIKAAATDGRMWTTLLASVRARARPQ